MKLRSQINRAELIHALKACEGDKQQLAELTSLFGYEASVNPIQSKLEQRQNEFTISSDLFSEKIEQPQNLSLVKKRVRYYYLAYRERYATEASAKKEQPNCFDGISAITDDELINYWEREAPMSTTPIIDSNRIAPIIRNNLRLEIGKRLDIKTLVKKVAKLTLLKKIPAEQRSLSAGRVILIVDLNQRLVPFWGDIIVACELIKQIHGKAGLDIRVLAKDEPLQDYYRYDDWQQRKLSAIKWKNIAEKSAVFILSDMGQLAPHNSTIRKRWLSFTQKLNQQDIKPLVLAPLAAEIQSFVFQSTTKLYLWQRFGKYKIQNTSGNKETHKNNIKRILSFLSLSPHVELCLLRSLCELLPHYQGSTGVEAEVYLHDHVQFGMTSVAIKPEHRMDYQQYFKSQPESLKKQVFECIKSHHSSQFAPVLAETILNAEQLMEVPSGLLKDAQDLMLRFSKRYHSESSHDGMMRFARRHLSRLKSEQQQSKEYASILYGLAYSSEIKQGQEVPKQFNTRLVNQMIREPSALHQYCIRQTGAQFSINLITNNSNESSVQFGQTLATFNTVQKSVLVNQFNNDLPARNLAFSDALHIDTGQEYLTIRSLNKPSWASAIMMRDGRPIATLELGGHLYSLELQASEHSKSLGKWEVLDDDSNIGFDEFGLFADISFFGIKQRFRYLEPNTFMMGSPEDEDGRNDNEDLHQVTLTEGYWLADTACTQELWTAVMENNPAEFNESAENPIEHVSWLEVKKFISLLKAHTPDLNIQLPTEAQWENACRAGTITPFNFKEDVSPERINYSKQLIGSAQNKKDEFINESLLHRNARQKTKPAKSYTVNSLGLYQMHGNVWEWCLDEWTENLGNNPVIDPKWEQSYLGLSDSMVRTDNLDSESNFNETRETSEDIDVARVIRGGSWMDLSSSCRSARRDVCSASNKGSDIGFRLSISISKVPTVQNHKMAFVHASPDDLDDALQVAHNLKAQGWGIMMPRYTGDASRIRKSIERGFKHCDILLVLQKLASADVIEDYLADAKIHSNQVPILVLRDNEAEELFFIPHGIKVISYNNHFDYDYLKKILAEMQA